MSDSLKTIINNAISNENRDREEKQRQQDAERAEANRAKLKEFQNYQLLEGCFGEFLQAMAYAYGKDARNYRRSLNIGGTPKSPYIELQVNNLDRSAEGYIRISLSDMMGVVHLEMDEKFYGTNTTDKIKERVNNYENNTNMYSITDAQKALAVIVACSSKKFQKDVKFALSWKRFLKKSFLPIMNEEYGCKNSELNVHSTPVPKLTR